MQGTPPPSVWAESNTDGCGRSRRLKVTLSSSTLILEGVGYECDELIHVAGCQGLV